MFISIMFSTIVISNMFSVVISIIVIALISIMVN